MAVLEAQGWKQFRMSSKAKHPDLFYCYKSSRDSLLLQLTDLVTLWQSSLSKSGIITAASQQHCSIDPAESADQLNVFLSRLGQSVEIGNNILANGDDSEAGSLLLRTQMSLPRPLQPFAFTFTLRLGTASQFSGSVLRPLLKSLLTMQSQFRSLQDQIKAKDHVIAKLLDRVGTQAVDMSIIFPTLTGVGGRKGNVTVEMAKKRISGMEAFDHDAWLEEFDAEGTHLRQVRVLIRGVEKSEAPIEGNHDWTKQLSGRDVLERANGSQDSRRASQSQSQSQSRNHKVLGSDEETASEDDFERQATPPSLRKRATSIEVAKDGPDPAQPSSSEDSPPPSKKQKVGRVRGIGGKRPRPEPEPANRSSPSPAADMRRSKSHGKSRSSSTDGTETASSISEPEVHRSVKRQPPQKPRLGGLRHKENPSASPTPAEHPSSPKELNRPTSSHASTPSHRLGRLGKGRQRTATASPASDEKPSSQPTTPSRRLGRIGVKKPSRSPIPEAVEPDSATASDDDDDLDASVTNPNNKMSMKTTSPETNPRPRSKRSKTPDIDHTPPAVAPERTPVAVETEEQKAARKKEELRKTIASGPAKKKRRF